MSEKPKDYVYESFIHIKYWANPDRNVLVGW